MNDPAPYIIAAAFFGVILGSSIASLYYRTILARHEKRTWAAAERFYSHKDRD